MEKILRKNNLALSIGHHKDYRPTIEGIPIGEKIKIYLSKFGFSVSIGKRWIIATK